MSQNPLDEAGANHRSLHSFGNASINSLLMGDKSNHQYGISPIEGGKNASACSTCLRMLPSSTRSNCASCGITCTVAEIRVNGERPHQQEWLPWLAAEC